MTVKHALTVTVIVLFALLLLTDTLVLVFEKFGAAKAGLPESGTVDFFARLVQVPWTWLAVAMTPLQLLLWTRILDRCDLSIAYPVSSLCFPTTMITATILFHEQLSLSAWIGAVLITLGVAIVGSDARPDYGPAVAVDTVPDQEPASPAANGK